VVVSYFFGSETIENMFVGNKLEQGRLCEFGHIALMSATQHR